MIQLIIGLGVCITGICVFFMAIKCFTKGLMVTRSKIVTGHRAWISGLLILPVGLFFMITGLGLIVTEARRFTLQDMVSAPLTPTTVYDHNVVESTELLESSEPNQSAIIKPPTVFHFTNEWYAAKSECWQRVIQKYPDSGVNGSAFRKRMLEYDEWAKSNNPELYANSNKPMIYADAVYKEYDELQREKTKQAQLQAISSDQVARERHTNRSQVTQPPVWKMFVQTQGFQRRHANAIAEEIRLSSGDNAADEYVARMSQANDDDPAIERQNSMQISLLEGGRFQKRGNLIITDGDFSSGYAINGDTLTRDGFVTHKRSGSMWMPVQSGEPQIYDP